MRVSNKKITVILENAREKEQLKIMRNILKEKVCPFCRENIFKFHRKPILKKGRFWVLTENQWPYKNTKIHLLAIALDHAEKLSDLNKLAGKELLELLQWAERKYKIRGGALGIRFGNPKLNKATVNHIHAHIITAKIKNPKSRGYKPIRFKIA